MILYRPVNKKELDLIQELDWKGFPPRLPEQPIFYPVLNLEYAKQINQWNIDAFGDGYIVEFEINDEWISRYPFQSTGGKIHKEYWIPAEELEEFNKNILGNIKLI